jgi:decaprenylphospho-beta-D-erythro-pentofuranosid-2-ulose 2-reductase
VRKVLIMGATSAIAQSTARLLAARADSLYLVGRRADALEAIAADLKVRGAPQVGFEVLDANDLPSLPAMLARATQALAGLDTVLIAHGTLSNQKACEASGELTVQELTTNAISTVVLLTTVAQQFEQHGAGTIAVISSVAGDRGRASNYVYGSAKAMVTAFLSGLRQRLSKCGVSVITIKPGFVDTPMTAAFPKGALWAQPQAVAAGIVRAIDRSATVVYLPAFWRPIMMIIRAIPERIFSRITL